METRLFLWYLLEQKKLSTGSSEEIVLILQKIRNNNAIEGSLAESFIYFFQKECEPFLDSLDDFFGLIPGEKKAKILSFQKKWLVQKNLAHFLLTTNERELQSLVASLYEKFDSKNPLVTIRSPRSLSSNIRSTIRWFFHSGVVFEIDTNLVGGMLLYRDSTIIDKSFSSLFSRIPSLIS